MIFAGGGHAYILVGNGGNFQSLVESQRGSASAFAIVASDGLTISHGTPDYIGTVMGDSTLMKEIRATGSAQGLGTYMQGRKQVFGMYEQVPGTSAYVISTVPIDELMRGRLSLAWQFVFLALGFGLIGAAGYFWYEKNYAPVQVNVEEYQPPATAELNSTAPARAENIVTSNSLLVAPIAPKTPPPKGVVKPPPSVALGGPVPAPAEPPDLQKEKAEAYRQVAAAMGQEMRAPLASILGFSQMVLSKTQDTEVVQAVESILREARSSRDVLDKLVTFSGERNSQKSELKIEGPIMEALKKIEGRIQEQGVRVEKDFKETSPWPLAAGDLVKVFDNLFENAIEAMERMQDKTLKISTWESPQGLHVRIVDSGEGIDRENLGRVFDPFFTTRSYAHHVGLGLSVAAGILKEHAAQLKLQSQRAQGTQVDIVFSPTTKVLSTSKELSAQQIDIADLPAEIPRLMSASAEQITEVMKESEKPIERLVDRNVDSLLELPSEDEPLQFLAGMGFDDDPPPIAPLPVIEKALSPKPAAPPPAIEQPAALVASEPEAISETTETVSVIIDKPSSTFSSFANKGSGLDSYRVEIRRPGKRT